MGRAREFLSEHGYAVGMIVLMTAIFLVVIYACSVTVR